jgi:hypothetical protein
MVLLATLLALLGKAAADEKNNSSKPTSGKPAPQIRNDLFPNPPATYERRVTRTGFVLWVNKEVLRHNDDPEFQIKPLTVLDRELETIVDVMYPKAVDCLRTILIWIDWDDKLEGKGGGAATLAFYLGGNQSNPFLLNKHGFRLNAVSIVTMREIALEHQPLKNADAKTENDRCVILHEMAHAVHHRVIGYNNPLDERLRAIYERAMDRKLYQEIKIASGRVLKEANGTLIKPYAATDHHEYFAELSCAYLNRLWYYPFDGKDLLEHDRDGYNVMMDVWGETKTQKAQRLAEQERKRAKARAVAAASSGPDAAKSPMPPDPDQAAETAAANKLKKAKEFLQAGKKADACEWCEEILSNKKYARTKAAEEAKRLLEELKK